MEFWRHSRNFALLDQTANLVVILAPPLGAPLLDSTASLSISNGITAPSTLNKDGASYDSEDSELSIPNVDDEASPASNQQSEFGAQEAQDTEASESSDAEAQDQSDDADFDMEENSPAPARNGGREQSSTSTESRRPAKRKLDLEDEHILANPALYGLRRSVRVQNGGCFWMPC